MLERIQRWLTLRHIGVFYNPFQERGEFSTWSGSHSVYWFSDKNTATLGQLTLAGTIILNEPKLTELSEDTAKYVVEHEVGHKSRSSIARGVFYGMVLIWLPLGLLTLFSIARVLWTTGVGNLGGLVSPIGQAMVLVAIGILALNIEELFADLHTLQYLSYDGYLDANKEISRQRMGSRMTSFHRFIQYTKPERVVGIHQVLDRYGLVKYLVR